MVHKLFMNNSDDIFIECEYNYNFDKWIPIKQSILKKYDNINTIFNITNKLKII